MTFVGGAASAVSDGARSMAYAGFMALVERNLVPDAILRAGIRSNCARKCLKHFENTEDELACEQAFIEDLRARECIAEETDKANEQHYEVPTAFISIAWASD